ncbi:unnamed protein product [Nippostrongylus brasiliensis]|uniref:t-SNARE coiled-coil homology domain-containing protein n=1 Tax=Nippostrongylus brasiliensis TaxID=27835 RepID=A0A0N4Y1D5_NIPBR|nr:unnamed protein product [Nippostrongylus brasiliensis]
MLKRRRLSESARFYEAECSTVSCTAFVHVMERVDGSVYVRFCLDHAGHSPSDQLRMSPPPTRTRRKRSNLKRSSHNLSDSISDVVTEGTVMSPAVMMDSDMACESAVENNNNDVDRRKKSEAVSDAEFDTSSLNLQISQRLDTTTDRLKVITQVLADLAVDIHAFQDRQCAIVI